MDDAVINRLQKLMKVRESVEGLGQVKHWLPAADWADLGTHLLLIVDLPGVQLESLRLSEEGSELTVQGERPAAESLILVERPSGYFSRTLAFPQEVIAESGKASMANGILTVKFEKKHPTIDMPNGL